MDAEQFPDWLSWFPPVWIAFWILLSIVVRKARDKPIIPKVPTNALYAERNASGRMASHCLIVAVTPDYLLVTPEFPFNLMFLPEIWGLEERVPRGAITQVSVGRSLASNLTISRRDGRDLKLKVGDPEKFADALRGTRHG